MNLVFYIFQKHVQEQHTVSNPTPAKRREQPVDLNVTFGQRSGLLWFLILKSIATRLYSQWYHS